MKNTSIYIDYDNVYIMLEKYYQTKLQDLSTDIIIKIKEKFASDRILTFKAFCDFQKVAPVLTNLQKSQVELRHVYSTGEGESRKNASDIALTIDVIKNLFNKTDCDKYVLVSSDSDMLPIINELTYNGKEVMIIYSKYGTKGEYEEYLKQWGVQSYTIESLLGVDVYSPIKEEEIKERMPEILEIVNNGIRETYEHFKAKKGKPGTCSKKDIVGYLEKADKFKSNDISLILDKLLAWNILSEIVSPYSSNHNIYLINKEWVEKETISLTQSIITIDEF